MTAFTGQTCARVAVIDANSGIGPCGETYGETEDYLINIIPPQACNGAPAPGNTIASAAPACANAIVNLSLQSLATSIGITFQWYNDNGPIAGATNSTYSFAMLASDTYYCAVTCTNSGLSINSNPVTVNLTSFLDCYCGAASNYPQDQKLYNVTVNGASTNPLYANTNGCVNTAPGPGSVLGQYANFKTLGSLTTMAQGATIPFVVEENECDGPIYYSSGIGIWIDFNHNASFNDPDEYVYSEPNPIIGPRTVAGTFTVPMSALNGQTVMRVIVRDGYAGTAISPCGNYPNGETEDYLITIGAVPANTMLNLRCFIEGYMIGDSLMQPVLTNQGQPSAIGACDTITVELHDGQSPYGMLYTTQAVLQQDGNALCDFGTSVPQANYYIVVKHRNAIQTWSANTVGICCDNPVWYIFTTSASQAYGANQVEVAPGVWALYAGDLNLDENIDLLDISALETDISNFSFGYFATDMNGDGNVDLLDNPVLENNINNFVFSAHP